MPASRLHGRAGRDGGREGGRASGRFSGALLRTLITATATSVANGLILATPPPNGVVFAAADSALLRAASESSLGRPARRNGRLAHANWKAFNGEKDGLMHAPAYPCLCACHPLALSLGGCRRLICTERDSSYNGTRKAAAHQPQHQQRRRPRFPPNRVGIWGGPQCRVYDRQCGGYDYERWVPDVRGAGMKDGCLTRLLD